MHNEQTVADLIARRYETLRSLKHDIGSALYQAIEAKIRYERTCLVEIDAAEEKMIEKKQQSERVLKSEYFVQKPLDANLI